MITCDRGFPEGVSVSCSRRRRRHQTASPAASAARTAAGTTVPRMGAKGGPGWAACGAMLYNRARFADSGVPAARAAGQGASHI